MYLKEPTCNVVHGFNAIISEPTSGDLYDLRTGEKLSPYHTHGQLEQGSRRRGSLYSYKDN
jgi:hypothetical protein